MNNQKKKYDYLKLKLDNEIRWMAESSAHKIAPLFNLFGWEWINKKPSLKEIKESIEEMIKFVIENKEGFDQTSSGRITVTKEIDETGQAHIQTYLNLDSLFSINDYE